MFKRILVPTDGSEGAKHALIAGAELAKTHQAELVIFTVADNLQGYFRNTSMGVQIQDDALMAHGKNIIEDATREVDLTGVNYKTKVVIGAPARKIIEEVPHDDIDLIVMGSRGYGSLSATFIGSVSNRVIQGAKCPVMIIKDPVALKGIEISTT